MNEPTKSNTPTNRLERLCENMAGCLGEELAVIMLRDGKDCAVSFFGYESELEALPDVFTHISAILRLNGKQLRVIPADIGGDE